MIGKGREKKQQRTQQTTVPVHVVGATVDGAKEGFKDFTGAFDGLDVLGDALGLD